MATYELVRVAGSTVLRFTTSAPAQADVELTPGIVAEAVAGMSRHDVVELLLDLGMADTRNDDDWHAVGRDLSERLVGSASARRAWFVLRTVLNGLEMKEAANG